MSRRIFLSALLIVSSGAVLADAPVVDYTANAAVPNAVVESTEVIERGETPKTAKAAFAMPGGTTSAAGVAAPLVRTNTTGMSINQRLRRVEAQLDHLNEQQVAHQVEELQQLIQKLTGQVEAQAYQIEQLNQQVKEHYQDLSRRLDGQHAGPGAEEKKTAEVTTNAAEGVTNTNPAPSTLPNENAFLQEQQMYQNAIDLLPEKKEESRRKLMAYLKRYPQGSYVANAHYWLGEVNYAVGNLEAAEKEFKSVISNYPKSRRVADAMLKLARIYEDQHKIGLAKQKLNEILKLYPKSTAAQLAAVQKRQLN